MNSKIFSLKNVTAKRFAVMAFMVATVIFAGYCGSATWARGGFGGGARGGYGGPRGGMDDFGRGGWGDDRGDAMDRGAEGLGYGQNFENSGALHPGDFSNAARPSDAAIEQGANRTYNWPSSQHGISAEPGFGKISPMAGNVTNRVSPAQLASRADAVRGAYGHPGVFDRAWWGDHPGAWGWGGWGDAWAWGGSDWPALAGWWGMPIDSAPTEYDYGNNITYQNDNIYYGTQPVESGETYYNQAQTLAESVPIATSEEVHSPAQAGNWKPLGVFSLVQGGQTNTTTMFQLAVDKKGAIRGNYYNSLTGEVKAVSGAINKKDMRAAWTVAGNKQVVYDTGLANLLKDQSPLLVHFGKEKTQQWTLVKLPQPKAQA